MIMAHFNVFGREVPVRIQEMDAKDAGEYCETKKEITINTSQKGELLVPTMVHELFHATVDRVALIQTGISDDMWEVIVENFATVVCENFDLIPQEHCSLEDAD
jgi:hypothetical protein